MNVDLSQKPGEATPRAVKNVFLAACLQYFLAGAFLLGGLLFGPFAAGFKIALFLLATGAATQYAVQRFLLWYLTG